MGSPPRNHLFFFFFPLLLFLYLFVPNPVSAENLSFDFPTFSLRNLTLLGDSYLRNGSMGLTRETGVPLSSSGTAICNLPILFHDPGTNVSASFSTRFSFSITNSNPESTGDGLTFFISPDNQTLGDTGGYLGLFNSSNVGGNGSIIAVEFDTRMDEGFHDPSSNHVGLDIDGPVSVNSTDLGLFEIDLKNGILITAWIDYYNLEKLLMVWVAYSNIKPEKPVLMTSYDLSKHFEEYMYVGFSASTEGSTEIHMIQDWSFRTFGFPNLSVSSMTPHNLSDTSWSMIPSIPVSNSGNGQHKRLSLALGITGPVIFCIFFTVIVWIFIKKRWNEGSKSIESEILKGGPRKFRYKELSIATRGFHGSRVVGKGAFGTVYRAVHPESGINYAVKRSKHDHQGKSEFLAELSIIACLRHKNLVQLQGWCDEKGELLLVYEFMPNGSLDKVLYNGNESGNCSMLKWPQRYNVATGIASALTYLHQECEQQVIHRDIKTSNILLDANFNPRLGDFGLAKLMDHNESPVSTLTAGTMGYLAPEYLQYGKATEKTDVFSFGVVVLEVCCGRRPIDKSNDNAHKLVNLVDWVWALYTKDKLIEAADPRLNGEFDNEEMMRLLLVGLSCANPDCDQRPSMRRVLQILNSEAEPTQVPRLKPCLTFFHRLPSLQDIVSEDEESVIFSPPHEV